MCLVRTLPNVIVFSVNLIVPEGFLHFTYLVFTVVMLPSSEVLAVAHMLYNTLHTVVHLIVVPVECRG